MSEEYNTHINEKVIILLRQNLGFSFFFCIFWELSGAQQQR